MVADEPDKIGEVGDGRLVYDEFEHGVLVDAVDVEGKGSDSDPDHALAVVEEFDGLRVQGKVVRVLEMKGRR